jgi:riboflavin kinase
MKPYLLHTLKELALLGAIRNRIEISSDELAKRLDTSQQTASRHLVELDTEGMISRELGVKKQLVKITDQGTEVLEKEFSQYKQIFSLPNKVALRGKVVSGMGEGRYYTEQEGYVHQFEKKLGFIPYPGTLNIEIEYLERNKLKLLKEYSGIVINEFETKDRTFGGVICFRAKINNCEGAIVLPKRGHYSNVLEFISREYLREKLDLKDGDEVGIEIYLGKGGIMKWNVE